MTSEPLTISSSGFDAVSLPRGVSVTLIVGVNSRGHRRGRAQLGRRRLSVLAFARGLDLDDRRQLVGIGVVGRVGVEGSAEVDDEDGLFLRLLALADLDRFHLHRLHCDQRGRRWGVGVGVGVLTTVVVACGVRRRLDEAEVVGGDAVEAIGLADLAGVGRRRRRGVRLPERVGAAVVRDVDVVIGDARAGAVAAGPGDGEAGRGRG